VAVAFRDISLADLTDSELGEMRREHETRFVENKESIGRETGFNFAKAVASFANTLGGWVLVGLDDAGEFVDWNVPESHAMTDRVRQALENEIDPMPPFAATVRQLEDQPVGVVRVYASIDAPHIMRQNGALFVRGVAEDRNAAKAGRFKALPVTTQTELLEYARRAETAQEEARELIERPGLSPLIASACRLQQMWGAWTPAEGGITIRAVPLMRRRMADWAVSRRGHAALTDALVGVVGSSGFVPGEPRPAASGLVLQGSGVLELPGNSANRDVSALAAVDAAGIVAMRLGWGRVDPPMNSEPLTLQYVRDHLIAPMLRQTVSILEAGEFFGRARLHLRIVELDEIAQLIEADHGKSPPGDLPTGGELALPGALDERDGTSPAALLADQWRDDLGRASGCLRLRP